MNSSNKINLLSIIGLLFISLFLVSCQPVTCNEPYILVGDSCCLDQDNNSICDFDDALIPEPEQEELGAQEVFELVEDSMYLVELRCDYVWETPTYELELSDLPRDEYEVDLVETDSLYPTDDFGYFQGAGFVVDGVLYSANHNVGCGTNDYELEMEWYMFELTDLYNLGYVLTWEDLIDFVEESTFDDQINEIFSYYEDYWVLDEELVEDYLTYNYAYHLSDSLAVKETDSNILVYHGLDDYVQPHDVSFVKRGEDFPGRDYIMVELDGPQGGLVFSEEINIGEDVFIVGFPSVAINNEIDLLADDYDPVDHREEPSITQGIVSSKTTTEEGVVYYVLDITADYGTSGGPVLNDKGEVLGIMVAGLVDGISINYMLPYSEFK